MRTDTPEFIAEVKPPATPKKMTKEERTALILKSAAEKNLPVFAPGQPMLVRGVACRIKHFGRKLMMLEVMPGCGQFLSVDDFKVVVGGSQPEIQSKP